jgi:hypothetical protein
MRYRVEWELRSGKAGRAETETLDSAAALFTILRDRETVKWVTVEARGVATGRWTSVLAAWDGRVTKGAVTS